MKNFCIGILTFLVASHTSLTSLASVSATSLLNPMNDDVPPLALAERAILDEAHIDAEIYLRKNIVFAWPKNVTGVQWGRDGLGASSPSEFADFVEALYERLSGPDAFNHNPHLDSSGPAWSQTRLVVTFYWDIDAKKWDGGCWQYQDHISYCSPLNSDVGTREWAGVLFHEMTHYFGQFGYHYPGYTEGLADFMRYNLNVMYGWNDIASSLRALYYDKCFSSGLPAYHGAAGALIEAYQRSSYSSLSKFIEDLKETDYLAAWPEVWEFFDFQGLFKAAQSECQKRRGLQGHLTDDQEQFLWHNVLLPFQQLIRFRELLDGNVPKEWIAPVQQALFSLQNTYNMKLPKSLEFLKVIGNEESNKPTVDQIKAAQLEFQLLLYEMSQKALKVLNEQQTPVAHFNAVPVHEPVEKGLSLAAFQFSTALVRLPSRPTTAPDATRIVNDLQVDSMDHFRDILGSSFRSNFALWADGYLKVPQNGHYLVFVGSDDGSRLNLQGSELINSDGSHGHKLAITEVDLEAGLHPFSLGYFQGEGDASLDFKVLPRDASAPAVEWVH